MTDSREWLKAHRCPHCTHRKQAACPYTVKERKCRDGWTCAGYRLDVKEWAK